MKIDSGKVSSADYLNSKNSNIKILILYIYFNVYFYELLIILMQPHLLSKCKFFLVLEFFIVVGYNKFKSVVVFSNFEEPFYKVLVFLQQKSYCFSIHFILFIFFKYILFCDVTPSFSKNLSCYVATQITII